MNFFKRLGLSAYMLFRNLVFGMGKTEEEMLTQLGGATGKDGASVDQKVTTNSLAMALLRGELTQEVEELVYRTYLVNREAKKYSYVAPTVAFKKDKIEKAREEAVKKLGEEKAEELIKETFGNKFAKKYTNLPPYENEEGYEVVLVQDNVAIEKSIRGEIQEGMGSEGGWNENAPLDYTLKVQRSFRPRYRIETFATKLVARKLDDTHHLLDLYVSIYPKADDPKNSGFVSKGFIREVEKIKDKGLRSDITDIERISFTTYKAAKVEDLLEYEYDNLAFKGVSEYDGSYILHFKGRLVKDAVDLVAKHYSKTMDEKYKTKAPKPKALNMGDVVMVPSYTCEMCGKKVEWDEEALDNAPVNRPRYVGDPKEGGNELMEYYDYQVAKMTVGKYLCKDCLEKFLQERQLQEEKKKKNKENITKFFTHD
ncbi:MAG: hypothetical protein LUD72_00095 [Bacteroidales bacterium]|nr:hypothetical protein [Bacteroidales bacterium]